MQNCPLSVVFGLGHLATATASSAVSICNSTHTVMAGARLYSTPSAWWAPPGLPQPRLCEVEKGDVYGRPARGVTAAAVETAACEQPCARTESGTVVMRHGALSRKGASPAKVVQLPPNEAHLLAVSGTDAWLVGRGCVRSASTWKRVCVNDSTFAAKTVATTPGAVLVADARGDVYAVHHRNTATPAMQAFLGARRTPPGTAHLLPPVLAASRLDSNCMLRPLGNLLRIAAHDGVLTRVFEHRTVTSYLPPATSATVWLPYLPADTAVCTTVPREPCHWSERLLGSSCVARRPCAGVAARPNATTNFVCGAPPSPRCADGACVRRRRQVENPRVCVSAPAPVCPPLATCTSVTTTAVALAPLLPTSGIERAPGPACGNSSFLLGTECVPCSRCGAGTRMAEPCSATADVMCLACPPGTYQPEPWHSSPRCFRANMCPGTTRYSNGVCAPETYNMRLLWVGLLPAWLVVVLRLKPR